MKRRQSILGIAIFALFLSSCSGTWGRIPPGLERDGKYDFSTIHFNGGLEKYMNSLPMVEAKGKPVFINEQGEKTIGEENETSGHAVIIPPYVLTVAHVVDLRMVSEIVMTPFGFRELPGYAKAVQDDVYFLKNKGSSEKISLEKIWIAPESDWALFKMPEGTKFDYPLLPFGRSGELRPGHLIYILGSPQTLGFETRMGIVSSINPQLDSRSRESQLELYGHLYGYDLGISVSIPVIGGDSGSRAVALRDGQPEIVGLTQATRFNVLGVITPIDKILSQIFEKTGIDLRKQQELNLMSESRK